MIGHTIIIGPGASTKLDPVFPRILDINIFKAGTQRAHQFQLRQRLHIGCTEPDRAIGQYHFDVLGCPLDCGDTRFTVRRVQNVKFFADQGLAFFRQVDQYQQRCFHDKSRSGVG